VTTSAGIVLIAQIDDDIPTTFVAGADTPTHVFSLIQYALPSLETGTSGTKGTESH